MFEALSDRFDGIFARIKGKGKLREEDVDETLREIRAGHHRRADMDRESHYAWINSDQGGRRRTKSRFRLERV